MSLFDIGVDETVSASVPKPKGNKKTGDVVGFSIPEPISYLIASLLRPHPRSTVYDPACQSGTLLLRVGSLSEVSDLGKKVNPPTLCGEEANPILCDWARSNMLRRNFLNAKIIQNDALRKPGFVDDTGKVQRFDYVVSSPEWNQRNYEREIYLRDRERFAYGNPPKSSADWGWLQHILASLKDGGKAAVVLDRGVLSRGSNSGDKRNSELSIRSQFVEDDTIDCVILLPYYKTRPCILIILDRSKPLDRKKYFTFIDVSQYYIEQGKRHILTQEGIQLVENLYRQRKVQQGVSKTVRLEEVGQRNYNLDPRVYTAQRENQLFTQDLHHRISSSSDIFSIQHILSYGIRGEERRDTLLGPLPLSWQVQMIADIAKDISSGSRQNVASEKISVEIPWVQIGDLNNNIVCSTQKKSTYSESQRVSYKIRPKGTVMIAKSRSTGKMGILEIQATTNHAICCIEPNVDVIDPFFLFYYLLSLRDNWSIFTSGTHEGSQLTHDIIRKVYVPLPTIDEQKEIVRRLREINDSLEIN